MSCLKLGRWAFLGAVGIGMSAACGGRGSLPTGGPNGDFGGATTNGGDANGGSVNGGSQPIGGSLGGSQPIGGAIGMGGSVNGGSQPIGGAGVCVPGLGFCKGNTIALCDATGSGYVTMACPMGQTCEQSGDFAQCAKQLCKPGQVGCNASGEQVVVCSADGANQIVKQDCAAQGQRCRDGACRSLACQPNQRFCGDSGVRLCNADGSASTAWQNCDQNQYCDPQSLTCKQGICAPKLPTCDGTVATTCNAAGSGYLPGGIDCAAQLDRQCVQGACLCAPGLADCDGLGKNGCEANVSTDPDNCGGCNMVCSSSHMATRTCDDSCNGACQMGFDDCNGDKLKDGCESNVTSDAKNCGGCGVVCSNNHVQPSCSGSSCNGACAANFNDCNGNKQTDGCESDQRSDAKNCGGCGLACSTNHIKAVCSAGSCAGDCAAGFSDCNGDKLKDGCEINLNGDAKNCGFCGNVCPDGQGCSQGKCSALYTFSGVANNLPINQLTGWTQCFSEAYGSSGTPLANVEASCKGSLLMMACMPKGASTLQIAAYGPRADVLFDTGKGNAPHNANGVGWYFNGSESWGFAPQGDAIERFTCDTQDSSIGNGGVDGDKRLCWHTSNTTLDGGWRCGKNDQLNASFDYVRLLFTAQ